MPATAQVEPVATIGVNARRRLAGFMRTLRDNGFTVGLAETRDALQVLTSPAAMRPSALKPALRSLLCATHGDWQRFDELFDAYWLGRGMRRGQQVSSAAHAGAAARQQQNDRRSVGFARRTGSCGAARRPRWR